jgi:hypothetical protein
MKSRVWMMLGVAATVCGVVSPAFATEEAREADVKAERETPERSRVGGHVGVATPLAEAASESHVIGRDRFLVLANPIGLSIHTSPKWTFDFEVIVTQSVLRASRPGLIIDPGVVYHFGPVSAGLRVAHEVAAPANIGAIALVNKGFEVPFGKWFVEAAFPTFIREGSPSVAAVLHTGIAF